MHARFKANCQMVERNNGIVRALFVCQQNGLAQEEIVHVNLRFDRGMPIAGKTYNISIQEMETTMTQKYQGKTVTTVRPAKDGDQGFDASKQPQSLIKLDDGSEKVVLASEVKDS